MIILSESKTGIWLDTPVKSLNAQTADSLRLAQNDPDWQIPLVACADDRNIRASNIAESSCKPYSLIQLSGLKHYGRYVEYLEHINVIRQLLHTLLVTARLKSVS